LASADPSVRSDRIQFCNKSVRSHFAKISYIMDTKQTIKKKLTENRFRISLFIMRLGGVPIHVDKTSTINFVYNSTVTICAYVVFIAMIMDFVVHRNDLKRAMKSLRLILTCTLCFWIHLNIR
jgi:hypothetical protein